MPNRGIVRVFDVKSCHVAYLYVIFILHGKTAPFRARINGGRLSIPPREKRALAQVGSINAGKVNYMMRGVK